jgi:tail protein P2 I
MSEKLYSLLPLVYREQDYKQRQPLRGLMAVLETAHDTLSDDIARMYQNWFIETCEESRIPYIADLVGMTDIDAETLLSSERRYVANHLAYSRRKGTCNTLCNVVNDSSDFACFAVNESEHIAATWTTRDAALKSLTFSTTGASGALVGKPFHETAKTADFRAKSNGLLNAKSGRINLRTVSIYLWRLQAQPVLKASLRAHESREYCFYISPFAERVRLSNQPLYLYSRNDAVTYRDYPIAMNRNNFDLLEQPQSCKNFPPVKFYEEQQDSKECSLLDASHIEVADLSDWQSVRTGKARVLIDPDLGRVYTQDQSLAGRLLMSYSYLSTSVFGAGPYRGKTAQLSDEVIYVETGRVVATLAQAVDAWKKQPAPISLQGNKHYRHKGPLEIELKGGTFSLLAGDYSQPLLAAEIIFKNTSKTPAYIKLSGVNFIGQIKIHGNINLEIESSTLINHTGLPILSDNDHSTNKNIIIIKSILKGFELPDEVHLTAADSVLVFQSDAYLNSALSLIRSTVLGHINCLVTPEIKDSLVAGKIAVRKASESSLLYSYTKKLAIGYGARLDHVVTASGQGGRLVQFHSKHYADADFALLSEKSDKKILFGASNGDEMGAFNSLRLRLREQKVMNRMNQYLPAGLEAQTIYMD